MNSDSNANSISKIDSTVNLNKISKSVVFTNTTHVWTITDYEWTRGGCTVSPIFEAGVNSELKFCLKLDSYSASGEYMYDVKLHVDAVSIEKSACDSEFTKFFDISILNNKNEETDIHRLKLNVTEFPCISTFVDRDFIKNKNFNLLLNNKLRIQIKVNIPITIFSENIHKHVYKMSDDTEEFFEEGKYTDVIFLVGGRKLRAHKIMLASQSKVFLTMFQHDMQENKKSIISVTDVNYETLAEVLRFIYTGKVNNFDKLVHNIIVAAKKYELNSLIVVCEKFLCKNLHVNNACDSLIFADQHICTELKEESCNYIISNAKQVIDTQGYTSIKKLHPHLLINIFESLALSKAEDSH